MSPLQELRLNASWQDVSPLPGSIVDPVMGLTHVRGDGSRYVASEAVNAGAFGAKGDVRGISDISVSLVAPTIVTSPALAAFTAADVGKLFQFSGAGTSVLPTGTTSNVTNPTFITAMSALTGIVPGMSIAGAGIPAGTTVLSIKSATIIEISAAATAAASGVALTISGSLNGTITAVTPATTVGGASSATLSTPALTAVAAGATGLLQVGTDDTVALTSFINALNTLGAAAGYIPKGVFFTGPLPAITATGTLRGIGRGPAPAGTTLLHKPGVSGDLLTIGKLFCVRDMGIDGNWLNVTGTGRGIVVTDAYAILSSLYVNGCIGDGIAFTTATAVGAFTEKVIVRFCQGSGINISSTSFDNDFFCVNIGRSGLSGFKVSGSDTACTLLHSWGNGTLFTANDGAGLWLGGAIAGCRFNNCYFETNGDRGVHGRNSGGKGHVFTGCFIWKNWTFGMYFFAHNNVGIYGCTLWDNGQNKIVGGAGAAGITNDTGQGWSLTGNVSFDDQGTKSQTFAYVETTSTNLNCMIGNNWQAANHATGSTTLIGAGNIPAPASIGTMNVV